MTENPAGEVRNTETRARCRCCGRHQKTTNMNGYCATCVTECTNEGCVIGQNEPVRNTETALAELFDKTFQDAGWERTDQSDDVCDMLARAVCEWLVVQPITDHEIEAAARTHFEMQEALASWGDLMAADQTILRKRMWAALVAAYAERWRAK